MAPLSIEEKKKLLLQLYWDTEIDIDYLFNILDGSRSPKTERDLTNLYQRLLNTFDWYTLLKLIPKKQLSDALEDIILNRLYPKDLCQRFKYAKNILSR